MNQLSDDTSDVVKTEVINAEIFATMDKVNPFVIKHNPQLIDIVGETIKVAHDLEPL